MDTIRVLITDDNEKVRKDLSTALMLENSIEVIGQAANGSEAISQSEALQPDVVLMDLEMPGLSAFEAIEEIKARHLAPAVIVLTVHGYPAAQQWSKEAGADAFLVKGTDLEVVIQTIEQIVYSVQR